MTNKQTLKLIIEDCWLEDEIIANDDDTQAIKEAIVKMNEFKRQQEKAAAEFQKALIKAIK